MATAPKKKKRRLYCVEFFEELSASFEYEVYASSAGEAKRKARKLFIADLTETYAVRAALLGGGK